MSDDTRITIEARENGPLVVKGLDTLKGPDGQELEVKPVMALCRCGGSKSKPFCDGSHKTNGFDGTSGVPAGRNRVIDYVGQEVTVTFNPLVCAHAAECARIAPKVFDAAEKPWVQPDKGSRAEIEEVIAHCPSGALALRSAQRSPTLSPTAPGSRSCGTGPTWSMTSTLRCHIRGRRRHPGNTSYADAENPGSSPIATGRTGTRAGPAGTDRAARQGNPFRCRTFHADFPE